MTNTLKLILALTVVSILTFGCASPGNNTAPAPEEKTETEGKAETGATAEKETESKEEPGEETPDPPEEDYDFPSDFLQVQAGKLEFKDFNEIISYLKDGQGYAFINVYGYDSDVLAVTDQVFLADKSASDASLYIMDGGKTRSLGVVAGNGSAFPLRLSDGIIYGGDNHNYEAYFMGESAGIPGIMQKAYVYDGVDSGGEFGGFLREENTFDNDKDFTGGQEEFDELIKERDSKPVIEFTMVGEEESDINPPFERGLEMYKAELEAAPKDSYYAFADLDPEFDALLIAEKDDVFSGDGGSNYALSAKVYAPGEDGSIREYGRLQSGSTALPVSVKDGKVYYGNHTELFISVLNKKKAEIDTKKTESFDELPDDVTEISFFPVSEASID